MDSDIWLPLATLVLGWAGAQITELLRDRRTTTRHRLDRRAELQRTTLLGLQEALGGAWLAFLISQLEEEELEGTGLAQVSRDFRPTRARVRLLASRVEDERVRELATALAEAGQIIPDEPESAQALRELGAEREAAPGRCQGPR